jgi:hypothetical protein
MISDFDENIYNILNNHVGKTIKNITPEEAYGEFDRIIFEFTDGTILQIDAFVGRGEGALSIE